ALVDHRPNALRVARTHFRHQEALFPPLAAVGGEGLAHDLFRTAVVVVPAVVKKRDALIEGRVHDFYGLVLVLDGTDVPSAETEDRHVYSRLAERPCRDAFTRLLVFGFLLLSRGGRTERNGSGRGRARLQEFAPRFVRVRFAGDRKAVAIAHGLIL